MGCIEGFNRIQRHAEFPFSHRDRNVRDVLAHVLEWQQMFFNWYEVGMAGEKPDMPATGFTWKTTPQLNAKIWERYQSMSLKKVREQLDASHDRTCELIDKHTQDELFEKRRYAWTGTTSLGAYLISATSAHYQWATKLLSKYAKSIQEG